MQVNLMRDLMVKQAYPQSMPIIKLLCLEWRSFYDRRPIGLNKIFNGHCVSTCLWFRVIALNSFYDPLRLSSEDQCLFYQPLWNSAPLSNTPGKSIMAYTHTHTNKLVVHTNELHYSELIIITIVINLLMLANLIWLYEF